MTPHIIRVEGIINVKMGKANSPYMQFIERPPV